MKYAITGATGALGNLVIDHLLALKVPASSIVALARSANKAQGLKSRGVTVVEADYEKAATLEQAFEGVERLLLISSNDLTKRAAQHEAVIKAAKKAGVKLVVYTSLAHADSSTNPLAPDHKATESVLKLSGLNYVILRNNWYTENYGDDLKRSRETGLIAAAVGEGRVASASRIDYAEAAAKVLIGEGHVGKTYELTGAVAWNYHELATAASTVLGRTVQFHGLSASERHQGLLAAGLPEPVAQFVVALDRGIEQGSLSHVSSDLATLLGRPPRTLVEGLRLLLA